ncbi:MAG: hypothetical protein JWO66_611, partial [Candidatus Eremiobacteraeota bacterium]|nr:hypothetical protein [Candidatus Eremiobacteraeota bacterium]
AVPAAQLDGLTGIANRIALDACLAIAWSRGRRAQSPLAALIVDVDHFRTYNQTYGHLAGDDILRRIADALATIAGRRDDLAGRHGGDKFLVLLPDTDLTGAQRLGDAVRAAVFALEAAHGAVPSKRVTVSVGVASLVPDDGSDGAELVRRAGIALHIAKTMGRNRVVADEPIAPG